MKTQPRRNINFFRINYTTRFRFFPFKKKSIFFPISFTKRWRASWDPQAIWGVKRTLSFRDLVHLNQATTLEEKKYYAGQVLSSRAYKQVNPLKKEQYNYYAQWYHIAIRELINTQDFQNDPHWIAKKLEPQITPTEASEALETLLKLNLIKYNDKGCLIQTDKFVSTGDEVSDTSVKEYHHQMIHMGATAMERIEAAHREISSLTLNLSAETSLEIKKLIQRFRKEILSLASQEEASTGVYQINFQLFPLTEIPKENNSWNVGIY